MRDVLETAAVCTACASMTAIFIGAVAFVTKAILAPAVAELAAYAANYEVFARAIS